MKKLLLAVVIVTGLGIGYYFPYQYNYNEAKDAMSLVMPKLVYALPTFETLEEKKFNDVVDKFVLPEHRYLTENLTDSQRTVLYLVLAMGQKPITTEERLKNIIDIEETPPDPEEEARLKKLNETATLKAALPFAYAESPVRYNIDEVNDTEIPYTAPGQILIYISAETEYPKYDENFIPVENETETLPNSWSGNIRFDSGSKSVSYAGVGKDEFIMDCAPGTHYGVIFQNDEDSGSLTVMILGSDYTSLGSPESLEFEQTYAPYGIISISGTCPSFDPAIAEELLSYRD